MGAVKFRDQLKSFGVDVAEEEARRIISIYRETNGAITNVWREAQTALMGMYPGEKYKLGRAGVLKIHPNLNGIELPSGLLMRYEDLATEETERGLQFSYKTRAGVAKIYGCKVRENV